jgi:hypothetical protein
MSSFDIHSDATVGIVDALIVAEAMRTVILHMSALHKASCCEETYRSGGLPMRDVDELDGVGDRTCHWSAIITLLHRVLQGTRTHPKQS